MTHGLPSSTPASARIHETGIVNTQYYSFIDALRGIAILGVLAVHVPAFSGVFPSGEIAVRLVNQGARGVQLFFILSAFTLLSTSMQRFPTEHSPTYNFYLRRAFRILPLWWLALFVAYLLPPLPTQADDGRTAVGLFLHSTFLFGFFPNLSAHSLVPGAWSLFCEETFYLFIPLIYQKITDSKTAVRLVIALLGVSITWHLAMRFVSLGDATTHTMFTFFFPLSQWFVFATGILFYFLYRKIGPDGIRGMSAYLLDILSCTFLAAVLILPLPGPKHYPVSFALLLFCLAMSQRSSLLRRVFDNVIFRQFGRCCYSIYLFHVLLLHFLEPYREHMIHSIFGETTKNQQFLIWYAFMAMVLLGLGSLSFHIFEKPMVRLGRRYIAT